MFPAIPSKSYEPDVDRFGWQAGSVLERIATQRGGIVVTARNQVGSQSPYRTVRNWQSPRSYESPLRPAPAAAAGPDDGEQLEVEGVALDEQERQHLLGDLAPEDLQPHLGVANVQAEEEAAELLVAPAGDPPGARVVHDRVRMSL